MVDFAGWSMPLQYTSIVEEHVATRTRVGLFDISHMGRLTVEGSDAAAFVDGVVTRRVTDLRPGQTRYGLITDQSGGILDDVLIHRRSLPDDGVIDIVVNAGNRAKIVAWLDRQRERWRARHGSAAAATIVDRTAATAMIAVQGPRAIDLMGPLVDVDLDGMKYYSGATANIAGTEGCISRTGYTGEDGCEIIVRAQEAEAVWRAVLAEGRSVGAVAAGLGSRDTLRMEAAMPLYGHEIAEEINPVEAGLMFAVSLPGRDFPGRDRIARLQEDTNQRRRVGLQLAGRRVPRQGHPILAGAEHVGEVTSGTFSPTLQRPIAMGYVRREVADGQAEVAVEIRRRREPAAIVPLPFYSSRNC